METVNVNQQFWRKWGWGNMGSGSGGRLGATAAVLPGSGLSKIHIGQYGCRNICIIIEEYLIKQGES